MSAYSVQQTSLDAYHSLIEVEALGTKQQEVLQAIQREGPLPNRLLAERLGWPVNTVTPRVLELREMGLIKFSHKETPPGCTRSAIYWKAAGGVQ